MGKLSRRVRASAQMIQFLIVWIVFRDQQFWYIHEMFLALFELIIYISQVAESWRKARVCCIIPVQRLALEHCFNNASFQ